MRSQMNKKLTLVSVIVDGNTRAIFVPGEVVSTQTKSGQTVEKTVVDRDVFIHLTNDLYRGDTYSVG